MLSGTRIDVLFVPDRVPIEQVGSASSTVFADCWSSVRQSSFPGFNAIDFYSHSDVSSEIGEFEGLLGTRPLLEAEVEKLFDPVTGARL